MICPFGAIEINSKDIEAQYNSRLRYLINQKYPEFFEKAKTAIIDNRSTLFRPLSGEMKLGNIKEFYGEAYRKRPRYVIHNR